MSKAFVNDDAPAPEPDGIPERRETLPITAAGERALRAALAGAAAQKDDANQRRARVLNRILETVYVPAPGPNTGRVVFGGQVEVEDQDGAVQCYRIVGPDEVHLQPQQISVGSPFARALLGREVGERVTVRRPKGDLELTILKVWPPAE